MSNIVDTIKILKRLKTVTAEYPTDLFESRRAEFFSQVASIRAEMKISEAAGQGASSTALTTVVEQLLQYLAIGMVIAASALGVYTYWDDIRNFFAADVAEIQIVDEMPDPQPFIETNTFATTPVFTETLPVFTETLPIFTLTPSPNDVVEPMYTPAPTEKTHPGLHLGQTKTPKPNE